MRKCVDEGKSLRQVLLVFDESLRDEIKTCYQSCLDDDDYPYTNVYLGDSKRHSECIRNFAGC